MIRGVHKFTHENIHWSGPAEPFGRVAGLVDGVSYCAGNTKSLVYFQRSRKVHSVAYLLYSIVYCVRLITCSTTFSLDAAAAAAAWLCRVHGKTCVHT